LALALFWALAAPAGAIDDALTPSSGAWQYLQPQFYGERPIGVVDETYMSLDVPTNTADPSVTPLTVHFGPAAIGHIKKIRVIIDNNPSPLAATFDLAGDARISDIGIRVRIDRFTSVRAVAETDDGRLEMRSNWVKASGGCSTAPSAAGGGTLGDIRFHNTPDGKSLAVAIRHPNYSGFQIDPRTGDPIPPHYVARIRLDAGGRAIMSVDAGISLSENPSLRIVSDVPLPTPIAVDILDSENAHFSARWLGTGTDAAASSAALSAAPGANR
jgi:sulfur-oxidizing protein SoxY